MMFATDFRKLGFSSSEATEFSFHSNCLEIYRLFQHHNESMYYLGYKPSQFFSWAKTAKGLREIDQFMVNHQRLRDFGLTRNDIVYMTKRKNWGVNTLNAILTILIYRNPYKTPAVTKSLLSPLAYLPINDNTIEQLSKDFDELKLESIVESQSQVPDSDSPYLNLLAEVSPEPAEIIDLERLSNLDLLAMMAPEPDENYSNELNVTANRSSETTISASTQNIRLRLTGHKRKQSDSHLNKARIAQALQQKLDNPNEPVTIDIDGRSLSSLTQLRIGITATKIKVNEYALHINDVDKTKDYIKKNRAVLVSENSIFRNKKPNPNDTSTTLLNTFSNG